MRTGQPKGFAYVQFARAEDVDNAVLMNEAMFKDRALKVTFNPLLFGFFAEN